VLPNRRNWSIGHGLEVLSAIDSVDKNGLLRHRDKEEGSVTADYNIVN
jgi:hypothetical protein